MLVSRRTEIQREEGVKFTAASASSGATTNVAVVKARGAVYGMACGI